MKGKGKGKDKGKSKGKGNDWLCACGFVNRETKYAKWKSNLIRNPPGGLPPP